MKSNYSSVFHPTDFSEGAQGAFEHALKIALASRQELDLLHVPKEDEETHWSDYPHIRSVLSRWKLVAGDASKEDLRTLGVRIRKSMVPADDPVEKIIEYVGDHSPDLIVLSTHQRQGLNRWLLRSKAEPIARETKTITLFVPRSVGGFVSSATGTVRLANVLIPIDAHPRAQRAVDEAVRLVHLLDPGETCFHLFHAGPDEDMPRVEVPDRTGWRVERTCWEGPPVDRILQVSSQQDMDLIVMATAGHHGFLDALRGSVTERVVRDALCPVLAVSAH